MSLTFQSAKQILSGLGLRAVDFSDGDRLVATLGDYKITVRYAGERDDEVNISLSEGVGHVVIGKVDTEDDLRNLVWSVVGRIRFHLHDEMRILSKSLEKTEAPFNALREIRSQDNQKFLEKLRSFNKPFKACLDKSCFNISAVNIMDGDDVYLTIQVPKGIYICEADLIDE